MNAKEPFCEAAALAQTASASVRSSMETIVKNIETYCTDFYRDIILMDEDFLESFLDNYMEPLKRSIEDMCKDMECLSEEGYSYSGNMQLIVRNFIQETEDLIEHPDYVCKDIKDFLHFVFIRACRHCMAQYLAQNISDA